MTEPREIALAFAELALTPLAVAGTAPHLSRLLRHCLLLTEAAAADVLTDVVGEERVSEVSAAPVRELLDLELEAGNGPTLDCLRRGEAIGPVSVSGPSPWPHITAAAGAAGYTTAYAHPLRAADGDATLGALVLYAVAAIDADHRDLAQRLADTVAGTIAAARTLAGETARADQLQRALTSRVVIEQAKGILVERHRISLDDAFDRLRRESRTTNRKIHDVATALIASTLPEE